MASNPISQSDSSDGSSSGSARFSVDVSNFTIHVYSPIIPGLEFRGQDGLHSSIDKVSSNMHGPGYRW